MTSGTLVLAALGGHVERCEKCAHLRISYNSCRNRHCPKCQAAAAKEWLADPLCCTDQQLGEVSPRHLLS